MSTTEQRSDDAERLDQQRPARSLDTLLQVQLDAARTIAGSTRMHAGKVQKIALNRPSTLMAIHLGHVHDGLMVNLGADNAKLTRRARREAQAW